MFVILELDCVISERKSYQRLFALFLEEVPTGNAFRNNRIWN